MGDIIKIVEKSPLFTSRRIPSLYADFKRLKESNEEGYQANIAAWKSILKTAISNGNIFDDRTCIQANDGLVSSLSTPDSGRPLAIDAVLDEMVRSREIIPLHQFINQTKSIDSWNWGIGPTISWVINRSGIWDTSWKSGGGKTGSLKDEKYVSMMELNRIADNALDYIKTKLSIELSSYTHSVFTREMFDDVVLRRMDQSLTQLDCDCIVKYLSRDRKLLSSDKETVKLTVNRNESGPITEQDKAVANLRATTNDISKRVEALSNRIRECTDRAKQALVDKNRVMAKYAVQSRKMAEETQAKSLDMLSNLEHILSQIDSSSGQAETVEALRSGVNILGELNRAVGGAEEVGTLVDKLREQADETDAIGNEISQLTSTVVDEDDIDEELKEMTQQETQKKLDSLQDVPVPAQKEASVEDITNDTKNMSISDDRTKMEDSPETNKEKAYAVPN